MEIVVKSYPEEAKSLIEVWDKHINSSINGLGVITFVNKRPKRAKGIRRRIAGLEAESIAYLKDDTELVKMSVENFICLMAKVQTYNLGGYSHEENLFSFQQRAGRSRS